MAKIFNPDAMTQQAHSIEMMQRQAQAAANSFVMNTSSRIYAGCIGAELIKEGAPPCPTALPVVAQYALIAAKVLFECGRMTPEQLEEAVAEAHAEDQGLELDDEDTTPPEGKLQ